MTSPLHQLSRASKKTQPADVEIAQEMQAARPEALQNREGVNTLCSQDESLEAPSSQNRPLHLQQNDADSSQQEFGSHTNTQGAAGFSLASSSVPEEGMNVLGSQQKQTPHASELLEGDHQQACGVAFWGGSPERNGAIPSPFGLREHHQQQPPRDRHASLQERSSFSDDGGSLNAYLPHVGALTQTSCPLAGKEQRRAASSVLDPTYQQEDSLFNAASLAAASRGSNIEGNGDFGNTPFAGMLSPTADTHFPPSVIADAKNMLYNDLTLLSWLEPKPILEPPFSHQKSASEDRQVGNGFRGTAGTAPYQDPSRAYPQPFESVADGIVDGNTASWALPSSMSRAAQIASTRNLPMHHNLFTKYREDDTAEIMDIDSIDSTILPTDSKAMHIGAHMASNHNSNESSTGSSDSNGPQVGHFPTHQPSSHVCYNSSFSSSYSRADQLVEAQDDAPGDQAAKFLESLADERQWATEPQKDNGQDLGIHDPVHEFANSSTLAKWVKRQKYQTGPGLWNDQQIAHFVLFFHPIIVLLRLQHRLYLCPRQKISKEAMKKRVKTFDFAPTKRIDGQKAMKSSSSTAKCTEIV